MFSFQNPQGSSATITAAAATGQTLPGLRGPRHNMGPAVVMNNVSGKPLPSGPIGVSRPACVISSLSSATNGAVTAQVARSPTSNFSSNSSEAIPARLLPQPDPTLKSDTVKFVDQDVSTSTGSHSIGKREHLH